MWFAIWITSHQVVKTTLFCALQRPFRFLLSREACSAPLQWSNSMRSLTLSIALLGAVLPLAYSQSACTPTPCGVNTNCQVRWRWRHSFLFFYENELYFAYKPLIVFSPRILKYVVFSGLRLVSSFNITHFGLYGSLMQRKLRNRQLRYSEFHKLDIHIALRFWFLSH